MPQAAKLRRAHLNKPVSCQNRAQMSSESAQQERVNQRDFFGDADSTADLRIPEKKDGNRDAHAHVCGPKLE